MALVSCLGYLGSGLGILLSTIVLAILVHHFQNSVRSLLFRSTTCTIHDSIFIQQFRCHCGRGCRSLYPCLNINAFIDVPEMTSEEKEWPVPFYSDDKQYLSVIYTDEDHREQCAVRQCTDDTNTNRDRVDIFRQKYARNGMNHTCYYDPKSVTKGAFMERKIHWSLAFHVIFWPASCLATFISFCAYTCYVRRRDRVKYVMTPTESTERGPYDIEKY